MRPRKGDLPPPSAGPRLQLRVSLRVTGERSRRRWRCADWLLGVSAGGRLRLRGPEQLRFRSRAPTQSSDAQLKHKRADAAFRSHLTQRTTHTHFQTGAGVESNCESERYEEKMVSSLVNRWSTRTYTQTQARTHTHHLYTHTYTGSVWPLHRPAGKN